MKRTFLLAAILALTLIPLVAQAHDFVGTGDCDSWNLVLDGDYGAHHIYVDGVDVNLDLTPEIADSSTATSRSFTVFWDKTRGDVTVTHTLYRNLENCQPPSTTTTTQPEPTTTTTQPEPTTTTTQPEPTTTTTVQASTTTTVQDTTTTQQETTTTAQVTTTTEATTTTDPTTTQPPTTTGPSTTTTQATVLPFTGTNTGFLALAALALAGLGVTMIKTGRKI